eukprot:NODE_70_length_24940_cov_0.663138.p24 type:complete len:123 gc:universal NODE_70_length_24940_cov_0.663138:22935-23303(+)
MISLGNYISNERNSHIASKLRSKDIYFGKSHLEYSKCMYFLESFWSSSNYDESRLIQRLNRKFFNEQPSEKAQHLKECLILTTDYMTSIEVCNKNISQKIKCKSLMLERKTAMKLFQFLKSF